MADAGMTGPIDPVVGLATDAVLRRSFTGVPYRSMVADDPVRVDCVIVTSTDGKAACFE
jgi:calcineurin-like phosphoesterase